MKLNVKSLSAFFLSALLSAATAQTSYYWDPNLTGGTAPGGNGTWTPTSANWWTGSAQTTLPSSTTRDAIFSGMAGEVTLNFSTAQSVRKLIFESSGYSLVASTPATITLGTSANGIEVNTNGTATIGSGVTITTNGSAPKWFTGSGTLSIANGATLSATHASAAATILSGTLDILNGGTVSSSNDLYLGFYGTTAGDALLKLSGGTVTIARNILLTNSQGIGKATLAIDAGTLNVTGGVISFGLGATAVHLNNGVIHANRVTAITGNTGVFNFNGGTLRAAASDSTDPFFSGIANSYIKEGGATIDTNGFDVSMAQAIQHGGSANKDGGLIKNGTGTLRLQSANTFTGNTKVNAGTLQLDHLHALSNSTLDLTGSGQVTFGVAGNNTYDLGGLTGEGTLDAGANSLSLTNGLALDTAPSLSTITAQTLSLNGVTSLKLDGLTRGDEYSSINLTGDLIYGGVLNISLGFTPAGNTTFNLFNFTGNWGGSFSSINFIDSNYTATFDYATGVLTVVPEPSTVSLFLSGMVLIPITLLLRRNSLRK